MKFWMENSTDKALLVTGARQVGKTFLIEEFCNENFPSWVGFNLVEQTDVLEAFNNAKSAADLTFAISAYAGQELIAGQSVVFIDEVQECKEALTFIKFLVKNTDYKYILSGSLLGVEMTDLRSAPVGYVSELEMFPLDFEEFCWACGIPSNVWQEAESAYVERRPVNEVVHMRLLQLFHSYLCVGGMPAAVAAYVQKNDAQVLFKEQTDILKMYKYDITKYAQRDNKLVIREIYDSIPSQLDNQSKRFNFASIAPKGTYERYMQDFMWLVDASVVILDRNVKEPKRPLRLAENKSFFKLYMNDVGLLSAACGMNTVRELVRNPANVNYGSIYENAVAQELHAHGCNVLFFRNRNLGEVDFILESEGDVLPIEVKSGKTYKRHSALTNLLKTPNYGIEKAVVLCESNVECAEKITYLPIYMCAFIKE
jgi:hypothetical protein